MQLFIGKHKKTKFNLNRFLNLSSSSSTTLYSSLGLVDKLPPHFLTPIHLSNITPHRRPPPPWLPLSLFLLDSSKNFLLKKLIFFTILASPIQFASTFLLLLRYAAACSSLFTIVPSFHRF